MEHANGYLPPAVGGKSHLVRNRLMGTLVRAQNSGHRLFLIEGQAGQGKSTLAAQFISERAPQYLWYPIVEHNRDPAWFIQSLIQQLKQSLNGFSAPFLEEMVAKGEIVSVDCHAYGVRLAQAMTGHPPVALVFDDLHHLEPGSPSVAFLKGFFGHRVPQRTLILLSRYPLTDLFFDGRQPVGSTRMSGGTLAMNRGEIADCLTSLFQLTPTRERVAHLHTLTEGWVMGVLAQAQSLHNAGDSADLRQQPGAEVKAFLDQELIESFPQELLPLLMDLSWCDTIPMELARALSGRNDICTLFTHLVRHNFFTRFTGDKSQKAVLHHHLQHCLRERSRALKSERELQDLFTTMAQWYETHGKPEDAARFYLNAGNHDEVERLIRERGLALCSAGRLETLRRSIGRMPEEAIKERGWLACNYGISLMEVNPPGAFEYLKAAEACFLENEDALGLLIARVQQIYYHSWVDALFNEGKPLLEPVHNALRELEHGLEDQIHLKALYCLACGYTFFEGNLALATLCSEQALTLALKKGYDNAACEIRIIRVYIHCIKGDWRRFNLEIESLAPLLSSPRVSSYNRFIGWLTLLKTLLIEGDTGNYHYYRELTPHIIQNDMILNEVSAPFFHIWDMDAALSNGDADLAERIASEALTQFHAVGNPHMQSQLLHYQAFTLAMQHQPHKVPAICQEALRQRTESGSPFFTALTMLVTGAALTHSDELGKAEPLLLEALHLFESMGEDYEQAAALAHLSHLYGASGRHPLATSYTAKWLGLMKHKRYRHHFSWPPTMLTSILDRAVTQGIEVETAKDIASTKLQRGYTAKGTPVLLLSISSFGCFSIAMGNRNVLSRQDLTTSQQRLLALILSHRDGTLSVDEIQTLFWPDASPQKGRASLDTMVSRLKKTLKKAVDPYNPTDFLSVKKEKLVLANVSVDAWRFTDLAEEGLQLFRAKAFWQAANRFRTAFSLVKGPYLAGFTDDGTSHEQREYVLQPLIQRAALAWLSAISCLSIPTAMDLTVIEDQITGDPESLQLVKALHGLHTEKHAPHRAASLLRKYRRMLASQGIQQHEIESLLEEVWC